MIELFHRAPRNPVNLPSHRRQGGIRLPGEMAGSERLVAYRQSPETSPAQDPLGGRQPGIATDESTAYRKYRAYGTPVDSPRQIKVLRSPSQMECSSTPPEAGQAGRRRPIVEGHTGVESRSGAVAFAPFPLPAHRTGRAVFRHPALGQELTLSPTGSSWSVRSGGPVPTRRAGTDRGTVTFPGSSPCASRRATGGAGGGSAGRWLDTPGSRGRGRSSSTIPEASGSVAPLGPRPPSRAIAGRSAR